MHLPSRRWQDQGILLLGLATVVLGLWEPRTDPDLHQQWAGT